MKKFYSFVAVVAMLVFGGVNLNAQPERIFDFENLTMPDTGFWNGSDTSIYKNLYGNNYVSFYNFYDATWDSWSGFAFSNWTDITAGDYANQWSVYTGEAHSGNNFGLGYVTTYPQLTPSVLEFSVPVKIDSLYMTNSTYTALTIRDGNAYARAFSTDSADYYEIGIVLISKTDTIDTVKVRLADYTLTNNGQKDSIIVDFWKKVDLSSITDSVIKIAFYAVTTDVGDWGPNTPFYFCIDDIAYQTKSVPLYTDEKQMTMLLAFYPNPVVNCLKFSEMVSYYAVYNLTGQNVMSGENTNYVDVSCLESGVYLIKAIDEKGKSRYGKFVKK